MRADEHPTTVTAATEQRRTTMTWRQAAILAAFVLATIALFYLVLSAVPPHAGS